MTKLPKVRICQGKSCRKRRAEVATLRQRLEGRARLEEVDCQKICEGPVVGLKVDGTLEWFESMDSPKSVDALVVLLETGQLDRPLAKRRVDKRSGRLRR